MPSLSIRFSRLGKAIAIMVTGSARLLPDYRRVIHEALASASAPDVIILFGSATREEFNADSDVDLMVVAPRERWQHPSRRQEIARLRQSLPRLGAPVDLLLFTPDEVATWRTARNHVICEELQQGVVLYERP